uniref:WAT1-related protein n=1 Tax=Brassica campestris TaxID=3711 RepID=M4DW46_BRACM
MVKFDAKLWKAVFMMSIINIALSVVNVVFKKMLDQGINRMVATTYRLAAGTLFLIPFAIFLERILCSLFFSALLGTSLVQYFFLVGLHNTSSTFALAFSNMVPSVTFALALVFRTRINSTKRSNAYTNVKWFNYFSNSKVGSGLGHADHINLNMVIMVHRSRKNMPNLSVQIHEHHDTLFFWCDPIRFAEFDLGEKHIHVGP